MAATLESSSEPRIVKLTGRVPMRKASPPDDRDDAGGASLRNPKNAASGAGLFVLTLPRQHGAWASLLSAFLLGTGTAGRFGTASVLLLIAMVAAFCGRQAALTAFRLPSADSRRTGVAAWTLAYATIFLAAGVPLVAIRELWGLLPLGAGAFALLALTMALERRRQSFSTLAETAGFIGLSLAAPAAEYTASGAATVRTAAVGLMAAAFFVGSMLHVRYVLRRRPGTRGLLGRVKTGTAPVLFHFHILGFASAAAGAGFLPLTAPLAFVPATLKVLWAVLRGPSGPVRVRVLGWQEAAHTALFVGLVAFAYHGAA